MHKCILDAWHILSLCGYACVCVSYATKWPNVAAAAVGASQQMQMLNFQNGFVGSFWAFGRRWRWRWRWWTCAGHLWHVLLWQDTWQPAQAKALMHIHNQKLVTFYTKHNFCIRITRKAKTRQKLSNCNLPSGLAAGWSMNLVKRFPEQGLWRLISARSLQYRLTVNCFWIVHIFLATRRERERERCRDIESYMHKLKN